MGSHVETELLAYLDGELSERERARVKAHLATCAGCTAELERLRAMRQDLGATFDAALTPVRLPAAADRRIRSQLLARAEPRPWGTLWRRRGLVAQALLAGLVLVFALSTFQTVRLAPPAGPQETVVLGQDRLAPGSQAALRVLVRSPDATAGEARPVAGADVTVRIGRTPGLASVVYTGRTDANGTAEVAFTVPEDLEGQASLVVETTSASGTDQIVHPIIIARDYKLLLSSDKPAYRPGQTVHLRTLALNAVDLQPEAGQEITFAILNPAGQRLAQRTVTGSEFGIAGLDFPLPPDAAHGHYTLRATLGDTISERTVNVGAYDLPAFRVTIETDRTFYAPGERVAGVVEAAYFFGKPVADGQVTLRGYVGDPERVQAAQVLGQTDDQGRFEFTFDLPRTLGAPATEQRLTDDVRGQFDLEVEVTDRAGQRVPMRRVLPVAAQPILISAIPESGVLKPGVENVVYILTARPDGRPAETTLAVQVDDESGQTTRMLSTGPYGLAELRYIPIGPVADLTVRARDAQGVEGRATFAFASDRLRQTILLRAEQAAYEVGDTLRAEALVAGAPAAGSPIYLDIVRTGQTIAALSAPVEDGRAVFALDLDGTMAGTLELHAYTVMPDGSVVRDTRLVIVDVPRQVAVAVAADRETYRPGDTAHIEIQTSITTTAGQSTHPPTALGIGVVDESVYALEDMPPGFARAYFLLEQALLERRGRVSALDVPTLLDAEAEIRAAQDVAARAAWAGAPGSDFTLSARSIIEPPEEVPARVAAANRLGLALVVLPLLLSAVVVRGLRPTGVLGQALRRVGTGALVLILASPLVAPITGGVMWLLWTVLGVGAPMAILVVIVVILAGLAVHGWVRRDARVQLVTGLLAAYLVLGGLLVALAARGGDPTGLQLAMITLTFLLAVAALALLGQGMVLEGWSRPGWATTLLGLLLILLAIYLPFVPGLASDLTRTLGNPNLYAGPVGWVTGCAPAATEAPAEAPAEEVEAVAETAGPAPAETTSAAPTASPAPTPAPTRTPSAREPFPLRQVFPETLYWNAEALTDENGTLRLDLPLADNITTWRLTALASTQAGELGVTTYDVVVFQDFFIDLDLPPAISQGQEVTVTVVLYNYLARAQTVRIEPAPADWYSLVSAPETLTIPPNDVATASFSIRAERSGQFSLQVNAVGERMSDAVAEEVTVEE